MTLRGMARYINEHYGKLQYAWDYKLVLYIHVRTTLHMYVRITDEHILECCEKADSYEVFMASCLLLGKMDEEEFQIMRKMKPPQGRPRRDPFFYPTQQLALAI